MTAQVQPVRKEAKIRCPDGCWIHIYPNKQGIYRTRMSGSFNEANMEMYTTIIEWAFRVIINS